MIMLQSQIDIFDEAMPCRPGVCPLRRLTIGDGVPVRFRFAHVH
jgi:hypothetical protein